MTIFALVRHGETDWNAAHRIQGSTDIPLNDTGRAQAAATGELLVGRAIDLVVASPLSRAAETATIIVDHIGADPARLDGRFVERNYGEAEGMTGAELDARFPDGAVVPGREEREDVAARVIAGLHDLAAENPGRTILVVAHGGVIRSVIESVAPGQHRGLIPNGSVHTFRHADSGIELAAFDDPIEEQSILPFAEDWHEQNPLADRERGESGERGERD